MAGWIRIASPRRKTSFRLVNMQGHLHTARDRRIFLEEAKLEEQVSHNEASASFQERQYWHKIICDQAAAHQVTKEAAGNHFEGR
jgi:hypothetical protein